MRVVFGSLAVLGLTIGAVFADPLPDGFESHGLNASFPPVTEDGVTTFHIVPNDCSSVDYGNNTGENDCLNGNTKSTMRYRRDTRLGEAVEFRFDVWVDPAFSYAGYSQPDSLPFNPNPMAWDSRLRIASWEGPAPKNFIDMLKLNSRNGLTFRYQQCQSPEDFGKWVTFSMKVRWASDERGWIKVTCDDRIILVAEGVRTNEQVHCYYPNECDPQKPIKNAETFNFILGLAMNGYGQNWQSLSGASSQFTPFAEEGLTIKMRNVSVTKGVELYGPEDKELVVRLQVALNALDCDVGAADGIAGRRTREAAVTCREFPEGSMPEALTIATLPLFVELYEAEVAKVQ